MIDRFIEKLPAESKTSLIESILICMAITIASGFLYYDAHYFFMEFYRVIVSVLIFAVWTSFAVINGKKKRWGFLVFSAAYWLLPYLFNTFVSVSSLKGTVRNAIIATKKFFEIMYELPFEALARSLGTRYWVLVLILGVFVVVGYYLGFRISGRVHEKPVKAEEASGGEADTEPDYESDDDDFGDLNSYLDNIDFDD